MADLQVTLFWRQQSKCEAESKQWRFYSGIYSEWLVFKEVYNHHQTLFLRLDIEN
jgi:hypothetical protein